MRNSFDWMILDRYLADDMRPGDLEVMEAWLAGHPSRSSLLKALIAERDRRLRAELRIAHLPPRLARRVGGERRLHAFF